MKVVKITVAMILAFAFTTAYAQKTADSTLQKKEGHAVSMKEIDEFHELLHPLVHDAFPKKDFESIRKGLPGLIAAASAMKNASARTFPKEARSKRQKYEKETKKLVKQLTDMNKKKKSLTDEEFGTKFMQMHDTFESIMNLAE